jgi:Lhr-like helicase
VAGEGTMKGVWCTAVAEHGVDFKGRIHYIVTDDAPTTEEQYLQQQGRARFRKGDDDDGIPFTFRLLMWS